MKGTYYAETHSKMMAKTEKSWNLTGQLAYPEEVGPVSTYLCCWIRDLVAFGDNNNEHA